MDKYASIVSVLNEACATYGDQDGVTLDEDIQTTTQNPRKVHRRRRKIQRNFCVFCGNSVFSVFLLILEIQSSFIHRQSSLFRRLRE